MATRIRHLIPVALALASAFATAQNVATNRCTALTFYGNASSSGLCKSLSPANQNLLVCELTSAQPDVHLTFQNAGAAGAVPLHLTVRTQAQPNQCQSNVNILRTPAAAYVAAAPAPLCGVNVNNYVDRMNAQTILPAAANQSMCRRGFLAAIANGKMTQGSAQGYLDACGNAGPANAACP